MSKIYYKQAEADFASKVKGKAFRFNDTADARKLLPPCPADFIVVDNGETYFAEVKASTHKVRFPKANLNNRSQKGSAKIITLEGGCYYYFIYSTHFKQWYKIPYLEAMNKVGKEWDWNNLTKWSNK